MNKEGKIFCIIAIALSIFYVTGTLFVIRDTERNKPLKKELKVDSVKIDKVLPDTTMVYNNPFPVRVERIELCDLENNPKFRVYTENGVVYYTDKKPKVGDIAFYLNNNGEITDKNGNKFTKQ
jgi:hypothetical protein